MAKPEKITCPICGGNGLVLVVNVDDPTKKEVCTCPSCRGRGEINKPKNNRRQ
jgi:DnaJ-class molecular chaperone